MQKLINIASRILFSVMLLQFLFDYLNGIEPSNFEMFVAFMLYFESKNQPKL